MLRKNKLARIISLILILSVMTAVFDHISVESAASTGSVGYGETINGNIVSADDVASGNDSWSGDGSVRLSEGTLWWVQYHNPLNGGSRTALEGPAGSAPDKKGVAYTASATSEYVYYRTVGMRFTLENRSDESDIPTLDMNENSRVWEKESVRFVDVFLAGLGNDVRQRTSALLESGPSAGGRRRVSGSSLVSKDITGSGGVIESHYYISDFLRRDSTGQIAQDCVVGRLIDLECDGGTLPTGDWRIYASHILEIMTATSQEQPNGQIVLSNRRERYIRDSSGVLVPDVRTTLFDMREAAHWASATNNEYLPALFNRYLRLQNERLIAPTVVVHYYRIGTDPLSGTVRRDVIQRTDGFGIYNPIELDYSPVQGARPENLILILDDELFENSGVIYDSYKGLMIFAGDSPDVYAASGPGGGRAAGFCTRFMVSGSVAHPSVTPMEIVDEAGRSVSVDTPYISVWVPLRSGVRLSFMYVTSDSDSPVLVRDGGTMSLGMGQEPFDGILSRLAGDDAARDLADPLKTTDGAGYELAKGSPGETVKYFYGTNGWDIERTAATQKSIRDPGRTATELTLTGQARDGRRYGVMGQGSGASPSFTADKYVTDVVFYVKVVRKTAPIETRRLYVRYVPASGTTHILKDVGPITIPAGSDLDHVFTADRTIEYAGSTYKPADDPVGAARPLLGVWTRESDKFPNSYSRVTNPANAGVYTVAQTEHLGGERFKITIPADAREAMLFIPCEEMVTVSAGADVTVYYIKASKQNEYTVLTTERKRLPVGYYEEACARGTLGSEFLVRTEVADNRTGTHWTVVDDPGSEEFGYLAIASQKQYDSLGNGKYPDLAGESGWTVQGYSKRRTGDSLRITVSLLEGARAYEIFVPCALKSGDNPVSFYAVDASSGRLLMKDPVATSFTTGAESLIDISDCEEISVGQKIYVILGESLESEETYPYKTSAYAYAGFMTTAVPSESSYSANIVKPTVMAWDGTELSSTSDSLKTRNVYINTGGLEIPSGNIIAVYLPYRTASKVNVFLLTDEAAGSDPTESAVAMGSFSVSRSYRIEETSALTPDEGGTAGAGWFEFEVPDEICDSHGTSFFMADDEPVAICHDDCCDGVLQRVGLCSVSCPLCDGTGIVSSHGRAGTMGAREKCSFCSGSGVWVTAMNYKVLGRDTALNHYGTEVKHKCGRCGGTGFDTSLAEHAHETKNCPECNRNGKGPYPVCPVCNGRGETPYSTWENSSYVDENGTFWTTSTSVIRYRTCSICAGRGSYTCGTCDGSGHVDGDLCMNCHTERYYQLTGTTVYTIPSYGSGYNVTRRDICRSCGGKGLSLCGACNGSGWSKDHDETGHLLPCSRCGGYRYEAGGNAVYQSGVYVLTPKHWEYKKGSGEIACSCVSDRYTPDPDPAGWDRTYSRGGYTEYETDNGYVTHRDNESFMYGGFYCKKCNAYILAAGFPAGAKLYYRKDKNGLVSLTVCGDLGREPSAATKLFNTQYRTVSFEEEPPGIIENHASCGLTLLTARSSYEAALKDTAHRTTVCRADPDEGAQPSSGTTVSAVGTIDEGSSVRMKVLVPNDSGTKATDVYILYTEWQDFSMPDPQPRVEPPEPYEKMQDVVLTDTDTDACSIRIVAGENGGVIYDPSLSIPSTRNLRLEAKGKKYLFDMTMSNTVGVVEVPVTVRYPYAFYESVAAYRRGDDPVVSGYAERRVTVVRPYSYWTVEKFAVWSLKEAGASTNVLRAAPSGYERIVALPESGTAPDFSVERRGGLADHIPNMPSEEGLVLTVDGFYADIFRNGAAPPLPELDEGYAQHLAYDAVPELTVLDDTLVFEGKVILGDDALLQGHTSQGYTSQGYTSQGYTSQGYSSSGSPGKTAGPTGFLPGEGELLTFYSADRKIPVTKPNGTYPVITATVYYTLVPGSVGFNDQTKYRSTGAPASIVVQTPVYIRGSLSMTDPSLAQNKAQGNSQNTTQNTTQYSLQNTTQTPLQGTEVSGQSNVIYVQQKDADTSQIWAVLGEEREYEGYDPAKASQTFCTCDLFASLTNTADASHPHLSYPGYGVRTFDSDIYTPAPGELPYNRISSDIRIVVDRSVRGGQISWDPDFIENYADIVLEAGEWMSVPADTVIRFIVPRNTPEGRHYITFASVATNKEDPEDTLSTAMEIANTYYLSHAVYDRKFFNVVGRLWGLALESVSQGKKNTVHCGIGAISSVLQGDNTLDGDISVRSNTLTPGENGTENECTGIDGIRKTGVGDRSAAGLVLSDPPGSFFPATEKEGIRAGVTAHFSIISDGVRANHEILNGGLFMSSKVYFVPYDSETGDLLRDEAVETDLWYDSGPYTGKPGLALFEPEIEFDTDSYSTDVDRTRDEIITGFSIFIPAGLRATVKGALANTPYSVGFTSNDSVWLKNGTIVITFDPKVTYRIADRTVTVGYDCGPADMWKLEGYRESDGFRKGDVLAFNSSSDIRDAFFVDHLN